MIKTIIADDEQWICKLIFNMVDWKEYGFSIVARAYDGETLLAQIESLQPDLVITDIRMPGRNGIDVIRECRDRGYPAKFVIISGYGDFNYAKTAISYGVLGYLLKPVEKSELVELLDAIAGEAFSPSFHGKQDDMLRKQLEQSRLRCLEYFLENQLTRANRGMPSIDEINGEFGSRFAEGTFRVFLLKLDPHASQNEEAMDPILEQTAALCHSAMRSACFDLCTIRYPYSVAIIANYAPENHRLIQGIATDLLYTCSCNIRHIAKFDLTIGAGSAVPAPSGLSGSLAEARRAVQARIQYGANRFIELSEHTFSIPAHLLPPDVENQIRDFARGQSSLPAAGLVSTILSATATENAAPFLPYSIARQTMELLLSSMPAKIQDLWAASHTMEDVELSIENCNTRDALTSCLSGMLSEAHALLQENRHAGHNAIERIKMYIDENYNRDIRLEDVADYVYLNANYISELFKKETGINFSKYLVQKRIETAKTFLLDTRYRINEVAAQVGYTDTKYFSRLFKEYVGVTPAQYRKMFS